MIFKIKWLPFYTKFEEWKNIKPLIIKIGIIFSRIKDGGIEKQTSLLLQELSKFQFLKLYLLSREKESGEYFIPRNIIRLVVYNNEFDIKIFSKKIKRLKIDILIYQGYYVNTVSFLSTLQTKIIILNHSSIFHLVYYDYVNLLKELYIYYKNFQLVVNLELKVNVYLENGE